MRIVSVDVVPVSVPRHASFNLSRGATVRSADFTVVRIRTDAGLVGWGECASPLHAYSQILTDHLVDVLIGRSPSDIGPIHEELDRTESITTERLGFFNPARAALDMALYDLVGKQMNLPVCDLLAGRWRDVIPLKMNIGIADVANTVSSALAAVERGFGSLKLRVGLDVDLDVARVRAVRQAVGESIKLRVDANQAWTPHEAIEAVRRMEEHGLELVEQPVRFWDVVGMAEVRAAVATPVLADEGFWLVEEAATLIQARAVDGLHVYVSKCGGLWPARRIAALAEGANVAVTVGDRLELGIAQAANLHYAASLKRLPFACGLLGHLFNEDMLLVEPIRMVSGALQVPTGPGLGVHVDEEKLERYRRR